MRNRKAPPGAMITDVPFAFAAGGRYMVSVGVTTFRTILFPPRRSDCSCQVQFSEPGGVPGQMGKTPVASELRGSGFCAKTDAAARMTKKIRIRPIYNLAAAIGTMAFRRLRYRGSCGRSTH